jgi:hypothetical protein
VNQGNNYTNNNGNGNNAQGAFQQSNNPRQMQNQLSSQHGINDIVVGNGSVGGMEGAMSQ